MPMPRTPDTPCATCGKLIWRGSTSRPAGKAQCRDCWRQGCGTVATYKRGCRCDDCKAANAEAVRKYVAQRKASGNPIPKRDSGPSRRYHLRKGEREAIYERDGWICQLCDEPVDQTLDPNHAWSATLDHIVPQSVSPELRTDPSNLRLAHRWCNARRGAGRDELLARR